MSSWLRRKQQHTELYNAAWDGHVDEVEKLLETQNWSVKDINKAIIVAAQFSNVGVVPQLVDKLPVNQRAAAIESAQKALRERRGDEHSKGKMPRVRDELRQLMKAAEEEDARETEAEEEEEMEQPLLRRTRRGRVSRVFDGVINAGHSISGLFSGGRRKTRRKISHTFRKRKIRRKKTRILKKRRQTIYKKKQKKNKNKHII